MPAVAPIQAYETPAPEEPPQARMLEPLPSFELQEPVEQIQRTDRASAPALEPESVEPIRRTSLSSAPTLDISEPPEAAQEADLTPLPAFELPEPDQLEPEVAAAPLPSFEFPETEPQPPAILPQPEFEILKPVDATSPTAVEPVELAEDDVAPDSSQPGPAEPPLRAAVTSKVSAVESIKSEPPSPPSRAAAAAPAPTATAPAPEVAASVGDEAVGATTKRNLPPPPPRRSFPSPSEVIAVATGADQSAAPTSVESPTEKPKSEEKSTARTRRPWWEELFNEDYSRALSRLSDEQIKREATFIEESLGVAQGGVVLDLGCGTGYHAVELAERGYAVVGYDLSLHQLALAAEVAQERCQKLNLMQGDMREMAFDAVFDGIYCWNTTFGYFEEEKNVAVAERIFTALKPGGTFLVDVINRDFVTMQQPSSVWFEGDSAVCMDDMTVDFISSRLRVKRSVMLDDGRTRECMYSIRLYSLHELGKLLHDVGFRVAEASGDPSTPGVFMGQNAPRIIILAQRP